MTGPSRATDDLRLGQKDQIVYFVAEFSDPFTKSIVEADFEIDPHPSDVWRLQVTDTGEGLKETKASFSFATSAKRPLLLKVAISPVSIEGARKNMEAELPGWDFDRVRAEAKAAWNNELRKIEVSGGTDDQTTTFYTALYHTMIQPNIFQDVDGSYRGRDGKVHRVSSLPVIKGRVKPPATAGGSDPGDNYTVFSLWDTFRAAHPLYTIIDQKRTVDFINTFIRQYEQGGRLPVWDLWGEETDCMIGYPAVPVIADAMVKGIKGFDYKKHTKPPNIPPNLIVRAWPHTKNAVTSRWRTIQESVSKTLEYAYDDQCIAMMAHLPDSSGVRRYKEKEYIKDGWSLFDAQILSKISLIRTPALCALDKTGDL